MPNAHDVAAYILTTHESASMESVRLQKLVYYTQAWHLVSQDAPLFANRIEAWKHGPVIAEIYRGHRKQNTVSYDDIAPGCSGDQLTEDQTAVIDAVVEAFRDLHSWSIVDVVHDEEPWITANESRLRGEDDKISDEEIKSFYARLSATPPSERGRSRVPRVKCPRVTYMSPGDLAAIDDDDDISGFVAAITAARKRG